MIFFFGHTSTLYIPNWKKKQSGWKQMLANT